MVSAPAPTARSRPKRTQLEPALGWAVLLTALTLAGLLVGLDRRAFSGKPAHLAGVRAGLPESRTEAVSERFESPYATAVLLGIPLVFGLLQLFGVPPDAAWYRAMTFMVVASPCAVLISTRAVMLSAMAAAARARLLFKSGAALETLASVKTIAFDKTGTLTEGKLRVTDLIAEDVAAPQKVEVHSRLPILKGLQPLV